MIRCEVLARDRCPAGAWVDWLCRAAWAVEALLTDCDHVVGVELLQVGGHLFDPSLQQRGVQAVFRACLWTLQALPGPTACCPLCGLRRQTHTGDLSAALHALKDVGWLSLDELC